MMPVWLDTERRRTRNAVHGGATPPAGFLCSDCPWGVPDRIRPCEGRGPGSIPGGDTFHFGLSIADCGFQNPQSANDKTLEPDGEAAACKAATSGFDSHRRLFPKYEIRISKSKTNSNNGK